MVCSMAALCEVFDHLFKQGYTQVLDIDMGARDMYITAIRAKGEAPRCFKLHDLFKEMDAE